MFKYLKLLFQLLVMIQGLSILCTGNGRMGSKLSIGILKVIQCSLGTMIQIFAFELRLVSKLVCKINKHKSTTKQKINTNKYQKEIRTYNKQVANKSSKLVDLRSYVKQQQKQQKELQ